MDLLYFLKLLFRKKWIILFFTFLAVAAAFIFLLFKKPLYESKAQYSTGFTVEKVKLSEGSSIADLYAADTKFDNVIETFKSPRVIGMISYKLLLHDLDNPTTSWRHLSEKQIQSKEYKAVNKEEVRQILQDKINKNELLRSGNEKERQIIDFLKLYRYDYYSIMDQLFIVRVNKTDYLDIVYRSENAELSAWLVNAMGVEFINYYKNLSYKRTEENVVSIREMEKQQQRKIDSLSTSLLKEKVSQGTIDPISLSTNAMETVKDLEGKLAEEKSKYDLAQNRILFLKQQQRDLESSGSTSTGSNTEVLRLMDQKHKLEADVASGNSDPDIQRQLTQIRNEINSKSKTGATRVKIADKIAELQNSIDEATALVNASQTTMSDYNAKISYYRGLTNINPGSDVKMDVIKSKLDIEQKQLSNLKDKLNQAEGLSKDDPTVNFTQTLIGQPAVEPEPKKAIMTMGISGMSMFFLTAFIFLFLEIFNTSIKTPYGFEKSIKLKLIGVINSVKIKKRSVSDLILNDDKGQEEGRPESLFKNNMRKLRYEIAEAESKVFLITSTRKKSGKTTIIEALAASMLLNKKRVLIIDMNMHNNTLTEKYNAKVMVQDIKDSTDLELLSQKKNIQTVFENLDIIGCIQGPFTPSESLYKLDIKKMVDHLKNLYDFIFIEGPALNNYADSNELVAYAEKVITIFSAEQVASQVDKGSVQFLQSIGNKNMGAVLNMVLPENLNF